MIITSRRQFAVFVCILSILHSPFFILNSPVHAGRVQLPKTGQTTSYVARDDGALERGVAWPSERFSNNGNGTVTDNLTGLIWLRDANCTDTVGGIDKSSGYLTWTDALTWSKNLSSGRCGLTDGSRDGDWRLPNVDELESLVDLERYNPALPMGHPFSNVQAISYWSSSTYAYNTVYAWDVSMNFGYVGYYDKGNGNMLNSHYVWPVRSGQVGSLGSLGTCNGIVSDDSGNPLAGATVLLGGNSVVSDQSGRYTVPAIPSGSYTVTVSKPGYSTITQNLWLPAGTVVQDFRLSPVVASGFKVVSLSTKYNGYQSFLAGVNLPLSVTATVNWNGKTPGKVRFITPKGQYDAPAVGATATREFNIASYFDPCTTLKAVAISADGILSAEKEADFMVTSIPNSVIPTIVSAKDDGDSVTYSPTLGFNWDFIGAGIDEGLKNNDMPFFGGNAFWLQYVPEVDFSFNSRGTGHYGIRWGDLEAGAAMDKSWGREHNPSKIYAMLKDAIKRGAVDRRRLPKAAMGSLSLDFFPILSVDTTFNPAACHTSWKGWEYDGNFGLAGEFETKSSFQHVTPLPFPPYLLPWYTSLKLSISADATFGVNDLFDKKFSGQGNLNPALTGAVGAGVDSVIGLEGSLTGGVDSTFQWPDTPTAQASLYVELRARLYAWFLEMNLFTKRWTYPESAAKSAALAPMTMGTTATRLLPRTYLAEPDAGVFHNKPTLQLKTLAREAQSYTVATTLLQSATFPHSSAVLATGKNTLDLCWLTDNPARSSANRTMLVHSTYDGTGWSNPIPVADDGTADFHPALLTLADGTLVAAWEDVKGLLPDTVTMADMISSMEISSALFDPVTKVWSPAHRHTANLTLEKAPRLAGVTRDNVLLTWIANSSNDIFGSAEKPNTLWYSRFNGTQWSAPLAVAGVNGAIRKYSLAFDGTNGFAVLSIDTDNDPSTIDDLELYRLTFTNGVWGSLERLTTDSAPDDNPQITIDAAGDAILVWQAGAALKGCTNFDLANATTIRNDDAYTNNLADFRLAASSDGKIGLLWAEPAQNGSDLFAAFFDPLRQVWGAPRQMTFDDQTESDAGLGFWGDNTLVAVYNRKLMTTANLDGVSDLYMLSHSLGVDLALQAGSLTTSPLNPTPGSTATVTVKAMNLGDQGATDVPVAFYLGDAITGTKIGEVVLSGTFAPGETRDVAFSVGLPVAMASQTITAIIDPMAVHDPINRSNNLDSAVLAKPDLAVTSLRWEKPTGNQVSITGRVSNVGTIPAGASSVALYRDTTSGTLLGTGNVSALLSGESADIQLLWDITALHDKFYSVVMVCDAGNAIVEFDENNNSGSVIVPGRYEDLLVSLTVNTAGTGGGSFMSTPAGIACNTSCAGQFVWGTPVVLTAATYEYSLFNGWSNGCAGTGDCTMVITGPAMVTVSFNIDSAHAVRRDVPAISYFPSIIEAYTLSPSPVIIKTWGIEFTENLLLDKSIDVTIKGGFNSGYTSNAGTSILRGTVTVGKGSLTVENVVVR